MIKLFRNIRRNLLNDGNTRKYFKYAIGEIVLVVVGILIALQINNWNEIRKSDNQEQLYLKRLVVENEQDISTFKAEITALEKGIQSIETFSRSLKSETISDSLLILAANEYFKFGSIYPIFSSSTSTFADLSSTGNLKIISNNSLRDEIVKHYAKHKHVAERIQIAVNWALPLDAPFTYENDIMKFEPSTAFLFPDNSMSDYAQELRSKQIAYISNAAAHYWINTDAITYFNFLIEDTTALKTILENELKNNDKTLPKHP